MVIRSGTTANAGLADQVWPWLLFGVAAAGMAAVQWKLDAK